MTPAAQPGPATRRARSVAADRAPAFSSGAALRTGFAIWLTCLTLLPLGEAGAQTLEVRNKSKLLLGRSQIVDTATFSGKRYSLGFTNTFREGRDTGNVLSGRIDPAKNTKLYVHTELAGDDLGWEVKLNQKIRAFTLDAGVGSDGLLHTGVEYGARKGKGFGFSAAWVGDERRSGANLQAWHYIETVDVVATVSHDRRGFGWSANTGDKLANVLRGVLRYETSSGSNGNGASQQVIYGRSMRDGSDTYTGFDQLNLQPRDDVFGDNGINIRSPLYPDDDPLAWLVEGYGARFGEVELDKKRLLAAEMVSYLTDTIWVGGDFTMKDGVTETIDTKFGVTGERLKLAATFGYAPQSERFSGAVEFRWTPVQPPKATK